MNRITYEMADTWLNELGQKGALQESSLHLEEDVPWDHFVELISHYCHYRGWEVIADSRSCTIYAYDDQGESSAEALQGCLSFEPDSDTLPF